MWLGVALGASRVSLEPARQPFGFSTARGAVGRRHPGRHVRADPTNICRVTVPRPSVPFVIRATFGIRPGGAGRRIAHVRPGDPNEIHSRALRCRRAGNRMYDSCYGAVCYDKFRPAKSTSKAPSNSRRARWQTQCRRCARHVCLVVGDICVSGGKLTVTVSDGMDCVQLRRLGTRAWPAVGRRSAHKI